MGLAASRYISPEEYLAMEEISTEKHEYFRGEVVAMAGVNNSHARISRNLIGEIGSYLKGKSAEVFGLGLRVTTPLSDSYMYPDGMIVCGPTEKKKNCFDTLTNPSMIIEILSPSASERDMNYKLLYYMQIPSLKEYIVISSTSYVVTTFRRMETGYWDIFTTNDVNSAHTIHTIKLQLALKDIYYMVEVAQVR